MYFGSYQTEDHQRRTLTKDKYDRFKKVLSMELRSFKTAESEKVNKQRQKSFVNKEF